MKNILLVSDTVLHQFACNQLSLQLKQRGQNCICVGPLADDLKHPFPMQEGVIQLPALDLIGTELLESAIAVGLFVTDQFVMQAFIKSFRAMQAALGRKQIPIFSGPLSPLVGDQLLAELYCCRDCDLVLLTGERQALEVEAMTRGWPKTITKPTSISVGFWSMPWRPPQGYLNAGKARSPHTLVVLAQENIPTHFGAKSQLLRQLIKWAISSPEWIIILQLDHSYGNDYSWFQGLEENKWVLPQNLSFSAPRQMFTQLASCSVCITVSSPWIYTAMSWGRRSFVIGDYGIHSDQGTASFFGSGSIILQQSITHLDQLLELPLVSRSWLGSMGLSVYDGIDRLIQAITSYCV